MLKLIMTPGQASVFMKVFRGFEPKPELLYDGNCMVIPSEYAEIAQSIWDAGPPIPDLGEVKAALKAGVDRQAELERIKYITPGDGQAMTYAQKAEEARRCLTDTSPDPEKYPMLAAEIGITSPTLLGVAGAVSAAHEKWLHIGAAIEAARLSAKKAITEAETIELAQAAVSAVVWP